MGISIQGSSYNTYAAATMSTYTASGGSQAPRTQKALMDELKKAFKGVNFVTLKDPLSGSSASAASKDTVYLDREALSRMERDPDYAAYIFSEIETTLEFSKGFGLKHGESTYLREKGSVSMSFYGSGKTTRTAFQGAQATLTTPSTTPAFCGTYLTMEKTYTELKYGTKQFSSFQSLTREICQARNNNYQKWAETLGTTDDMKFYVNPLSVWSSVKATFSL